MNGWIKLHRKITDWEWYQDGNVFRVFLHLLLSANTEDRKWKGIEIKRGQLVTGRQKLSTDLNLSEQTIRTCLNRLKLSGGIDIKSTSKYSIVTICEFERYQSRDDSTNQQVNQQITNNQPATNHKQELKNKKNKKKKEYINTNVFGELPTLSPDSPHPDVESLNQEKKKSHVDEKAIRLKDTEEILGEFRKATGVNYKLKSNNQYTTAAIKIGNVLKIYSKDHVVQTIQYFSKEWAGKTSKDGKPLDAFVRPETICDNLTRFKAYYDQAEANGFTPKVIQNKPAGSGYQMPERFKKLFRDAENRKPIQHAPQFVRN